MFEEPITVRPPAVAGRFYPGEPEALQQNVNELLAQARGAVAKASAPPRALILPHAGYPFSGAVAACGYEQVRAQSDRIRRILLLGPAHFAAVRGAALPAAEALASPLGTVPIDTELRERALEDPDVHMDDSAHAPEHSLEVHLPFLQTLFPGAEILPLIFGRIAPQRCGALIERLWDPDVLVVVSTDLSHFHDDATARRIDAQTTAAIESCSFEPITPEHACGAAPLRGLLWLARKNGLQVETLAQANSGDVTGDRSAVVGYGCYVLH